MIPSSVCRKFLARKLRDYRPWGKLTDAQIEHKQMRLRIRPPIWSKLKRHQKVMVLLGAIKRRFYYTCDTGTGKTVTSIALGRYHRVANKARCFLVLVPNRINKAEWHLEIGKHSPDTKYVILPSSIEGKWEALRNRDPDTLFVVETYSGFYRMVTKMVPAPRARKKKNKLKLDPKLMREIVATFDGLIMDESNYAKNAKRVGRKVGSLPFRICRKISKTARFVFGLTATPFGRDPTDLWGQLYIIDKGETLGPTLGLFREALFTASFNGFGTEWHFPKKNKPLVHRMLANRSIRFTASAADLPKVTHIIKEVELPQDAEVLYDQARQLMIDAKGNPAKRDQAFMRMRQISSGFVGFTDDDTGEKAKVIFDENPKLEMLLAIIESSCDQHKIVVPHEFIYSGQAICAELSKLGIGHLLLNGKTRDPQSVRMQFADDKSKRVLVLNSAAGGRGANLQAGSYIVFYELPVAVDLRYQVKRRVIRQHSEHERVFHYDLIAKNTADRRILHNYRVGGDLFASIIEGRDIRKRRN